MATHQATQDYVTARHAADLCHVSERTVRRHIASGKLPAERLPDGDYAIPVSALATLRKAAKERATRRGDLAGQLAALQAEVEALKARLDALETATTTIKPGSTPYRGYAGAGVAVDTVDASSISPPRARPPERHYNATFSGGTSPDGLRTHADALRWLQRHGDMAEGTPKTWPGWRDVPLTPADVLTLAIECSTKRGVKWMLRECSDSGCVCHALLGQAASE